MTRSSYALRILEALNLRHPAVGGRTSMYAGTVPTAAVERRRAANRVARRSRRTNRRSRG